MPNQYTGTVENPGLGKLQMFSLLILYVVGGILLILFSLPLLFEKVKPNLFYGLRVPATLNDSTTWYEVNKYFAKYLLVVGLLVTLDALVLYFLPGSNVDAYALSVLAVFLLVFSIARLRSWNYIKSIR